jgi:hypothetical protein
LTPQKRISQTIIDWSIAFLLKYAEDKEGKQEGNKSIDPRLHSTTCTALLTVSTSTSNSTYYRCLSARPFQLGSVPRGPQDTNIFTIVCLNVGWCFVFLWVHLRCQTVRFRLEMFYKGDTIFQSLSITQIIRKKK